MLGEKQLRRFQTISNGDDSPPMNPLLSAVMHPTPELFNKAFPLARSIVKVGDGRLTTPCALVTDIASVRSVIEALQDTLSFVQTLYAFGRGSGVAAPQIGELYRISVVEFEGERYVLINPEIIEHSPESKRIREGCLSFFDQRGYVPRYVWAKVRALDENGQSLELTAEGNFAMLLQHEIDHLDGILYPDRLTNRDADLISVPTMPVIP